MPLTGDGKPDSETYLHRVGQLPCPCRHAFAASPDPPLSIPCYVPTGRTGRFGRKGVAVRPPSLSPGLFPRSHCSSSLSVCVSHHRSASCTTSGHGRKCTPSRSVRSPPSADLLPSQSDPLRSSLSSQEVLQRDIIRVPTDDLDVMEDVRALPRFLHISSGRRRELIAVAFRGALQTIKTAMKA